MENPLESAETLVEDFIKRAMNNPWKTLGLLIFIGFMTFAYSFIDSLGSRVALSPSSVAKFSINTNLYLRDYPADKNIINLDNVGTLRSWGGSFGNPDPAHQITLALNFPITVLNKMIAPQSNGAAYSYVKEPDKKDLYVFDTSNMKSHRIKIEGRTFLVTLLNIKDLSSNPENQFDINYEYQFGVKEQ